MHATGILYSSSVFVFVFFCFFLPFFCFGTFQQKEVIEEEEEEEEDEEEKEGFLLTL
jgi:hypothetical protein